SGGGTGITLTDFNLNNCAASPCTLRKGRNVTISFTITAVNAIGVNNDTTIAIDAKMGFQSFSLPPTPLCGVIPCPIPAGTSQDVAQSFPLSPFATPGTYQFKITIKDAGSVVMCVQFSAYVPLL
ncbi:hypothetical protein PPYR_12728, partial [Photinus pyralis]